MINEFIRIGEFIMRAFLHVWPYLLLTIPLAVAVQMSGASKYIKRAFQARPLNAIVLATVVGAFSPFCSCGVIPVIASLLISGVPLAPVMSFWVASPSMDPEIFFLSVATIGWELAVWRLAATLVLSLSAGLITHVLMEKRWLGREILRTRKAGAVQSTSELLKRSWRKIKENLSGMQPSKYAATPAPTLLCASCSPEISFPQHRQISAGIKIAPSVNENDANCAQSDSCCDAVPQTFAQQLLKETLGATWMVTKFMALAFFLEGLITLYIPPEWISAVLGRENPFVIITAALLGVPAYTTSLTALPMMSGLLSQGMNPSAALTFLIAGPTTTLPAMAAVWPLVARRVFGLYVSFALVGAVIVGYIYGLVSALI